MQIYFVVIL